MNIHGLTVSVNYADMLSLGLPYWVKGLQSLVVVTDEKDDSTADYAKGVGATVHRTDVFYKRGATFNKAGAMQEARAKLPTGPEDWHLFFDADIVPRTSWRSVLEATGLKAGYLYGARRRHAADSRQAALIQGPFAVSLPQFNNDEPCAGFFQLFHSQDKAAATPLDQFKHAGVYDSLFWKRWPDDRRIMLNQLMLAHVGERDNWWGRGNKEDFEKMKAERKARGGYEHERVGAK